MPEFTVDNGFHTSQAPPYEQFDSHLVPSLSEFENFYCAEHPDWDPQQTLQNLSTGTIRLHERHCRILQFIEQHPGAKAENLGASLEYNKDYLHKFCRELCGMSLIGYLKVPNRHRRAGPRTPHAYYLLPGLSWEMIEEALTDAEVHHGAVRAKERSASYGKARQQQPANPFTVLHKRLKAVEQENAHLRSRLEQFDTLVASLQAIEQSVRQMRSWFDGAFGEES